MTISQNLLILNDNGMTRAVADFTHEVLSESPVAHEVIQAAVDVLAGSGGVVTFGRGTFALDAPIALADNVWLRGSGRGTRLQVTAQNAAGVGLLSVGHKGIVVSDLAIIATKEGDTKAGIVIDDSGDCKVHDVVVAGFDDYGIWLRNNAFLCEVRGCSLAGNGKANLYFDQLARGAYGDFLPNLATNCVIYGGGKGIDCNRAIVLNIVGCVVYQTGDIAYHVRDTSNSVLISACRSFQISSHAVVVERAHEFNLSSNIFCWHTGHGVLVRDCNWGTITGNEIIDTGSYNPGTKDTTTQFEDITEEIPLFDGIHLTNTKGYNISGNTIFNWPVAPRIDVGIREDTGCFRNSIVSNNINYYETADVRAEGQETEVANNVSYKDKPYQSPDAVGTTIQSFQTSLTAQFIESLLD